MDTTDRALTLFDLAYGCHLFDILGRGNTTRMDLPDGWKKGSIDLSEEKHCRCVIKFLRKWQCRHLSKDSEERTIEALRNWWEKQKEHQNLVDANKRLKDLDTDEIKGLNRAWQDLANKMAARRKTKNANEKSDVRFGPVAAAKTLYALRPYACPPWDTAIREKLGYESDKTGYQEFLCYCQEQIQSLTGDGANSDLKEDELLKTIGRKEEGCAKAIDEYHWVRFTRGADDNWPDSGVLEDWLKWCGSKS